jgi:predicted metalloprotease with PDZ domain
VKTAACAGAEGQGQLSGRRPHKRHDEFAHQIFMSKILQMVFVVAGLLVTGGAHANSSTRFDVRVDISSDTSPRFSVEARFAVPLKVLALFNFPSAERPGGQAESIKELKAFDSRGREVPIAFVGNGRWATKSEISRITYRVLADHDEVRWGPGKDEVATKFDRTWFFVGNAFFLMDPAYERAIRVRFHLPAGWRATTPWAREGAHWIAESADQLQQNAFAVGEDAPRRIVADGIPITLMLDSRLEKSAAEIENLLQALPRVYGTFWQHGLPGPITIFAFADPQTDGGAFRNSFALRIAQAQSAVDERVWIHLLAHELMHLWLGSGKIRGDASGSIYWFLEGGTDYLTARLNYDAKIIDRTTYEVRLGNFVRRYLLGARLTPDISMARAGAEKWRHYELIYGGGALFAMLLDRELSTESPGRFDTLMAELYRNATAPMTEAQLLALLDGGSAGTASSLVDWINAGPDVASLVARLGRAGMRAAIFTPDELYIELE